MGKPEDALGQIPVRPGPEVVEDDPLVRDVAAEAVPDVQAQLEEVVARTDEGPPRGRDRGLPEEPSRRSPPRSGRVRPSPATDPCWGPHEECSSAEAAPVSSMTQAE